MGYPSGGEGEDAASGWKLEAARAAVAEVRDGAIVGLGSGTTAELMLKELAGMVRQGLRVTGVATSKRTHELAAGLGIPLLALTDAPYLDLSIDGADEVTVPELALLKGHGGALLGEKLVAATSRRRIIIVDDSKLVSALGTRHPLPVEVIPYGWVHTAQRLAGLGLRPARRMQADAAQATPYLTDSGNYILDCETGPIGDPVTLAAAIKAQVGVVEHGLFVAMTERVIVAGANGVRVFDRPEPR